MLWDIKCITIVWFSVQRAKNHFSGPWCRYPPNKDTYLRLQHSVSGIFCCHFFVQWYGTVQKVGTRCPSCQKFVSVAVQLLGNVLSVTSSTWCEIMCKHASMSMTMFKSLRSGKKKKLLPVGGVRVCVFIWASPSGYHFLHFITKCGVSPTCTRLCGLLSCYRSSGWSKVLLLSSVLLLANGLRLITSSSRSPASVISGTAKQQSKSLVLTWFTWTAGRRKWGSSAACCWLMPSTNLVSRFHDSPILLGFFKVCWELQYLENTKKLHVLFGATLW